MSTEKIRKSAEELFATELEALRSVDTDNKPEQWMLSPKAVVQYLIGGTLKNGVKIQPKYIGNKRLMEIAVATLTTDRALLLYGLPGTAKSWVSEHLAAAISGNSGYLVQGTAGTGEEAIRYGWNYALLLSKGPVPEAIVETPILRAMKEGRIARIEELTRVSSDVQDTLITILSEKTVPVPELNTQINAVKGFNIIATANNRDKGVNELSSALKRRFNTVILPVPDTEDEEVEIVKLRVNSYQHDLLKENQISIVDEIKRVVMMFRELRNGVTADGKTKLKSPTGTLSTAEAISVMNSGISLAYHFGDGKISSYDLASGILGAIVKDPVQDKIVMQEYMETVLKNREGWKDIYRACRDII